MSVTKLTCPSCEATLKSAAAIATGAKIKCPKCGSGFTYQQDEVAEYDEYAERADDDLENDEEEERVVRPRKAKKKKKSADHGKIVMAVSIGAVVLLLAGGGYAGYRFFRTPDFEEPLAFVMPGTTVYFGGDIERVVGQLGVQSQFEQGLIEAVDNITAARCREITGLELMELCNQVTVSMSVSPRSPQPKGVFVLKSKKPFSRGKVEEFLNLKDPKKINGQKCFTHTNDGEISRVFIPSSRLIVVAFGVTDSDMEKITAADGTKVAVTAEVLALIDQGRQHEAWAVVPVTNDIKQAIAGAAAAPQNKDSVVALNAMRNATGFGGWLTLGGGQVKLNVGIQCPDATNAAVVNGELQKQWENQTKGVGAAAQMAIGLAMLPKPAQEVVRELMRNMRFSVQGTMAMMSTQAGLQGVSSAIEGLVQMFMRMGGQPGIGQGGGVPGP